jgi:nicotinate-nucleotide pyrophosphorylase (carboxylating)
MLDNKIVTKIIKSAIAEDIGKGDITTDAIIKEKKSGAATIIAKQYGILAGINVTKQVFLEIDPDLVISLLFKDSDILSYGNQVMKIEGKIASILKGERVALNFLSHMSGIASLTNQYVKKVKGTSAKITDTRKTTPLLRILEKESVKIGGGINHRMGLYDMVLIKENHIRVCGNVENAIKYIHHYLNENNIQARIEVETTSIEEIKEALKYNIDRIMLDNMTLNQIKHAVRLINHKVEVEVSGGINLNNVHEIAQCGVDIISIGAITHSAPAFDFTLLF